MSHPNKDKEVLTRRDALKTLAAISGALTLASLPSKWETPLVQVGALPAHACVSATPPFAEPGEIIASATWSPAINDDLYLDIASGTDCENIDFIETDFTDNGTGPLNVNGTFTPGTYIVDLDYYGDTALNASVTVTTEFGTTTFNGTVPPFSLVVVTRVNLPGGTCGGITFEVLCEYENGVEGSGNRRS